MSTEAIQIQQLFALAKVDLACFAVAMRPQFLRAPHHELIISKLEAVERGEISRLMIFLPPRHGKSLLGSVIFPGWCLGRHPDWHIMFASYAQELADDFGRQVRNSVADPLHRAIFPGCVLSADSTAAHRFNTLQGGGYFALGTGGPATGRGANVLIIDDPVKDSQEANSETARRSLHDWFTSVANTRLAPGGAIVLIQTRWHEDDLAGRVLANDVGNDWEVLSLPAIAEHDESFRREGEALWPERYGLAELANKRTEVGGRVWASQYQQRPAAAEGAIFKRAWWQFYRLPFDGPFINVVQSWDTAFKKGSGNDYSVCTTWGVTDNGYYLLHLWRERAEFPELKRICFLGGTLESKRNSRRRPSQRTKFNSRTQKLDADFLSSRSSRIATNNLERKQSLRIIEAGKVFLPEDAPWLQDVSRRNVQFSERTP